MYSRLLVGELKPNKQAQTNSPNWFRIAALQTATFRKALESDIQA